MQSQKVIIIRLDNKLLYIVIIGFMVVAGLFITHSPNEDDDLDLTTVARVIDGDTIELLNGDIVRLIGVDTPETVHPRKPIEYFGIEASSFTKEYLEGNKIYLEYDPAQMRDRYNRLLAYVRLQDGTDFNKLLIDKGYAHAYTAFPHPRLEQYRNAERVARELEVGLWSVTKTDPNPYSDSLEGIEYWLNTKNNTLHNAQCRYYRNTKEGHITSNTEGRDCNICGGAGKDRLQ
ncbi:thermonuclease precursor [bacterium BMS3Bbin04]|nr:thermonuclease precursor [bacterium BMS3Bbin04]